MGQCEQVSFAGALWSRVTRALCSPLAFFCLGWGSRHPAELTRPFEWVTRGLADSSQHPVQPAETHPVPGPETRTPCTCTEHSEEPQHPPPTETAPWQGRAGWGPRLQPAEGLDRLAGGSTLTCAPARTRLTSGLRAGARGTRLRDPDATNPQPQTALEMPTSLLPTAACISSLQERQ